MILFVSGRTDIVAFYSDWFMNRYREGFVDVRNPFNPKMISRINFCDVDAILFCTKNPIPILKYIKEIDKPIVFHITITSYKDDIEPNVPSKTSVIDAIKELSKLLGKDSIVVRYDPIFINNKYTIDYHIKAFDKLCSLVEGYVDRILVSFIDEYKNVRKNERYLCYRELTEDDYKMIGRCFSKSANNHNLRVHTCFEDRDLSEYGFDKDECMSKELAYKLTGKVFKREWKARKGGKCHCVEMVDIGVYNSCKHFCKYCYANYDELQVINNYGKHNTKSSLLIGELNEDDIIKVRKQ